MRGTNTRAASLLEYPLFHFWIKHQGTRGLRWYRCQADCEIRRKIASTVVATRRRHKQIFMWTNTRVASSLTYFHSVYILHLIWLTEGKSSRLWLKNLDVFAKTVTEIGWLWSHTCRLVTVPSSCERNTEFRPDSEWVWQGKAEKVKCLLVSSIKLRRKQFWRGHKRIKFYLDS